MSDKFLDVKKEKQDRVINGALKIFALNTYQHASTDDIVKEAGISKGLLFHYFGNKIGVYSFMYEYCIRYLCLEIKTDVELTTDDWFDLQLQLAKAKAKLGAQYPFMQLFLLKVKEERDAEVKAALAGKDEILQQMYSSLEALVQFPKNIDESTEKVLRGMKEYIADGILRESVVDGQVDVWQVYDQTVEYLQLMKTLCK